MSDRCACRFRAGHQSGPPPCCEWETALRLNPFQIRASVRTNSTEAVKRLKNVLIPFRSGHQSGPQRSSERSLKCVLIPFRSGHQSGPYSAFQLAYMGLNPFQIRASVRTRGSAMNKDKRCLNPFQIRASVRTNERVPAALANVVLIPFRSGHQSGPALFGQFGFFDRLNPFQIRASVRTTDRDNYIRRPGVLIPFRSGHQSGRPSTCAPLWPAPS